MNPEPDPLHKPLTLPTHLFIITAIVVALLLTIIGLLLYQNSILKQQLTQPTVLPTPSADTQESPVLYTNPSPDLTANWKTYINNKYGFETKYDPESPPSEDIGTEDTGQFTYLLRVRFGTNPLKFPHGYELDVNKQKSLDDFRSELIGHITDKIDSEEEIILNGNTWTKINYKIFLTTDYVPFTMAITKHAGYIYSITSSELDIDQILSTFRFIDQTSKTTQEQATQIVRNLTEVKIWISEVETGSLGGKAVLAAEAGVKNNAWTIHAFEQLPDHNATFNFFYVDKATGQVTKEFNF